MRKTLKQRTRKAKENELKNKKGKTEIQSPPKAENSTNELSVEKEKEVQPQGSKEIT